MKSNTLLVIEGHPRATSFGGALAESYLSGARGAGATVERLALRDLAFDPVLREGFSGAQALEPDLLRAREAIERAGHVAWFFPTWWAGPPALVKGFIDRVFLPGWAFAYREGRALPERLLAGRSARLVTTMDSPSWWYALSHNRSIHGSFASGTLSFVGFAPVHTRMVYGVRAMDEEARRAALTTLAKDGARDARALQKRAPAAQPLHAGAAPRRIEAGRVA